MYIEDFACHLQPKPTILKERLVVQRPEAAHSESCIEVVPVERITRVSSRRIIY